MGAPELPRTRTEPAAPQYGENDINAEEKPAECRPAVDSTKWDVEAADPNGKWTAVVVAGRRDEARGDGHENFDDDRGREREND